MKCNTCNAVFDSTKPHFGKNRSNKEYPLLKFCCYDCAKSYIGVI